MANRDDRNNSLSAVSADVLLRQRMEMQRTVQGGWAVAERFDDRYDTEVGGNPSLMTLSFGQGCEIQGGLPDGITKRELAAFFNQSRPAQIVDYGDGGRRYSQEEAESLPELAPVLTRLMKRIAEYDARQKTSSR